MLKYLMAGQMMGAYPNIFMSPDDEGGSGDAPQEQAGEQETGAEETETPGLDAPDAESVPEEVDGGEDDKGLAGGEEEEKPDESDKDKEGDESEDDADKEEGAPEKYEDFELPEGTQLDEAALEEFLPIARELELSQEKAQKLVTMYAQFQQRATEQVKQAFEAEEKQWVAESKKQANYKEDMAIAKRVVATHGGKELGELISELGLGHHPVLLKTFASIGRKMGEAGLVTTTAPAPKPSDEKSRAERWYPYHAESANT